MWVLALGPGRYLPLTTFLAMGHGGVRDWIGCQAKLEIISRYGWDLNDRPWELHAGFAGFEASDVGAVLRLAQEDRWDSCGCLGLRQNWWLHCSRCCLSEPRHGGTSCFIGGLCTDAYVATARLADPGMSNFVEKARRLLRARAGA